jgi:hypothetical protein
LKNKKGIFNISNNCDKVYHGFFFHFLLEIVIFLLEELDARFSNVHNNHDKAYHWKFSFFIWNILMSALIYINDFQIFITIVIKPIMEFLHFSFEIFLFLLERKERDLKIFITIMISNCYLVIATCYLI